MDLKYDQRLLGAIFLAETAYFKALSGKGKRPLRLEFSSAKSASWYKHPPAILRKLCMLPTIYGTMLSRIRYPRKVVAVDKAPFAQTADRVKSNALDAQLIVRQTDHTSPMHMLEIFLRHRKR